MKEITRVFKAVSDPNRLRILKMLEERPLCVCEITTVLTLAASTVSKHLSILKDAELIIEEKDGKWVNHNLNRQGSNPYIGHLLFLIQNWLRDDSIIQNDTVAASKADRNRLSKTE